MAEGKQEQAACGPCDGAQEFRNTSIQVGINLGTTEPQANSQNPVAAKENGKDVEALVDQGGQGSGTKPGQGNRQDQQSSQNESPRLNREKVLHPGSPESRRQQRRLKRTDLFSELRSSPGWLLP